MAHKLTIGFDASVTLSPRPGGIARYTLELLRALVEIEDLQFVVLLNSYRHRPRHEHRFLFRHPRVRLVERRIPGPWLLSGWRRAGLPTWEQLTRSRCDVVHAPASYLPPTRAPLVATVHDLAFLREKQRDPLAGEYFNAVFPRELPNAAAVITPSKFVANDVAKNYGLAESKVIPIHSGISQRTFRINNRPGFSRSGVAIITAAEIERKRPEWIEPACASLLRKTRRLPEPEPRLYVAGGNGFNFSDSFSIMPPLSDRELARLYNESRATLLTTREEGFGFPLLESLACGTPVVCVRHSSLAEIGGEFTDFVDKDDVHTLGARLAEVYFAKRSDDWRRAASEYGRSFSWRRAAKETARVYRDVKEG